jgi:hypothetical protein
MQQSRTAPAISATTPKDGVIGQRACGYVEDFGVLRFKSRGRISFAERQNLTLRMSSRRFTRRTNAFSKKVENHALSVALHYMNYNFCRIHKTLRITPAMAAGVTDRLWGIGNIVKVGLGAGRSIDLWAHAQFFHPHSCN